MANQDNQKIKISSLHLWTENPRDPVDKNTSDKEIIIRALNNKNNKWNLDKLIKEMGDHYDTSENPTVVQEDKKYIVYDGNKRIAIIKYSQNKHWSKDIEGTLFSMNIPKAFEDMSEICCNVCDKETAFINISRKHSSSGNWKSLDRDYFQYIHRGAEKTLFIKFDEATGLISSHEELNERIFKENILTETKLKEIGFSFDDNDNLVSIYDSTTAKEILDKLVELKINKTISSRDTEHYKKYQVKEPLQNIKEFKNIIRGFDERLEHRTVNYPKNIDLEEKPQRTPRTQKQENKHFFCETLELEEGDTNDLYNDIEDLYKFYLKNKNKLSKNFHVMIRMSLRLLIELSGKHKEDKTKKPNEKFGEYIKTNFQEAKRSLTQDQKTTLSNNSITSHEDLTKLLHTGAHNYTSSQNLEQTMAMGIIIGAMLKITHLKNIVLFDAKSISYEETKEPQPTQ